MAGHFAVVSEATRYVLDILSRNPALLYAVYEDLLYRIAKKGFEADTMHITPQQQKQKAFDFIQGNWSKVINVLTAFCSHVFY